MSGLRAGGIVSLLFTQYRTMRPLLYDLFCGAGGAGFGYWKAGFRVIGIDNKPQKHYPCFHKADYAQDFGFVQIDAIEFLDVYIKGEYHWADAFHASPPCQFISKAASQWRNAGVVYPNLIPPVRERLIKTGLPFIIENVVGEPYLINPLRLNGAYFGKNLRRTRYFETSFPMEYLLLPKEPPSGFRMGRPVKEGGIVTPVGHFSNVAYARRVMGIDWMNQAERAQAIPPAYTELIGNTLQGFLRGD